ncbi:hypothetical protein GGR51DRAFT_578717 [Nemania sp. FL0031]|nr:hypothetical protein GGR51DRAFT_578717 [Nemania sp. FL0031]
MSNQASNSNQGPQNGPQGNGADQTVPGMHPRDIDTRPHAGEMIDWIDVDFDQYTGPVLEQFANALVPPNPFDPTRHDYLESLPLETLLGIYDAMTTIDKLRVAYSYPHLFLSQNRINIFTVDAHEQLAGIHPNIWVDEEEEMARVPLLLEAITCGFSLDVVQSILDNYEEACKARGVDFNIFLNCDFPDRIEEGGLQPDHPEFYRRRMLSPLHAAATIGSLDVAEHLVARGADIHRRAGSSLGHEMLCLTSVYGLTPFNLALDTAAHSSHYFATQDAERDNRLLQTARRLGAHQKNDRPFAAFRADFRLASGDILTLIGSDVVEPYIESEEGIRQILEDSLQVPGVDRTTRAYQVALETILAHCLRSRRPLELVINWLIEHGAALQPRYNGDTMFNFAFTKGHTGVNVMTIYNKEHALPRPDVERESSTYRAITVVPNPESLPFIQSIADVMDDHSYVWGKQLLIWAAMDVGYGTPMRQWIVNNVAFHYHPLLLRRAIAYGDREVVSALLDNMESKDGDVDEKLPAATYSEYLDLHRVGFYDTPLNLAIAEHSWADAVDLLRRGADPAQVQPNLRHRIRRLRDRMTRRHPLTSLLVFEGLSDKTRSRLPINPGMTKQGVLDAVNEVFRRLLDDPNHPLPPFSRFNPLSLERPHFRYQLRNPSLDEDDEANDSDLEEDEPLRARFGRELKEKREAACRDNSVEDIHSPEAYGFTQAPRPIMVR